MSETEVENIVRKYVKENYESKGWIIPKTQKNLKGKGQHGADITLYHSRGDRIVIEVKKWSTHVSVNHAAFYSLFGQILSRIHKVPTAEYLKKRRFVIAVPTQFVSMIRDKVRKVKNEDRSGMRGGWTVFGRATNLRVWSVDTHTGSIKEYHWREFL